MNQIVKNKMQREIMVVNASVLFNDFPRETRFYKASEHNFSKIMVDNYEYMVR
jgi:hydroxypyruvate isomerase